MTGSMRWDVFVSYASEDADSVAWPLRDVLIELGVRVWLDETELLLGDSLRERIDQGLAQSRYGVVVLSRAFFERHWPRQELNGLAQREVGGSKVILPVWHSLSVDEVREASPLLADRVAANTSQGIPLVGVKILQVVRPDIVAKAEKEASAAVHLARVTTGNQLYAIVAGADAFLPLHDELRTQHEAEVVGGFLQNVKDWGDLHDILELAAVVDAKYSIGEEIRSLEQEGFSVHAARHVRRQKIAGQSIDLNVAAVAVLRGLQKQGILFRNGLLVHQPTEASGEATAT